MNVYCWYCFHEYVLLITFLVVIAFQMAGVQYVFIIQMGLSAVGINVVYCEVTVVLHHLLFSHLTCIIYCWYLFRQY